MKKIVSFLRIFLGSLIVPLRSTRSLQIHWIRTTALCLQLQKHQRMIPESLSQKTISFPPVAASSLRNDSIGSNTSSNSNKEALGFISSSSLQGISIALTSLLSLLIGFILGAIYWKKTHPKSRPESNETIQCHGCQEENEISMLQQKEKEHLQVQLLLFLPQHCYCFMYWQVTVPCLLHK